MVERLKKIQYISAVMQACRTLQNTYSSLRKNKDEIVLGYIGDHRLLPDIYFQAIFQLLDQSNGAKFYFFTIADGTHPIFEDEKRIKFIDSVNIDEYIDFVDVSMNCGSLFEKKLNYSDKIYLSYLLESIQVKNQYDFTLEHWTKSLELSPVFLDGTLETFEIYGCEKRNIADMLKTMELLKTYQEKAAYLIQQFWYIVQPTFFLNNGVNEKDSEILLTLFKTKSGLEYHLQLMKIIINNRNVLDFFKSYSAVRHSHDQQATDMVLTKNDGFVGFLNSLVQK